MNLPTYDDVERAAAIIASESVTTPLIESHLLNERLNARVFLKAECLQRTGSFKFRGAFNALSRLSDSVRETGLLATSSGNHAQGVAEAARLLGYRATIVMPADAPTAKKARTRRSGGTVVEYDRYTGDRDAIVNAMADEAGAPVVHPYDNFDVIAGQGTMGLEIAEALKGKGLICDRALVCAGGGGLMSGTLIALKYHFPEVKVHPVEPEYYDDHRLSQEAGKICDADTSKSSVCDAILAPRPGEMAFAIGKNRLAPGLVITDEEALHAVAFAFHELNLVVEPGGAAALAALLAGKVAVDGEVVVATLSGGNIDPQMLQRALATYTG